MHGAPIFDADGRVAGFILERSGVRYLDKRIDQARHLFRKYNGYGIGDAALTAALADGARYARFHDDARGLRYLADLALFRTAGVRVDFGHGVQWVLPLKHWTQPAGQDSALIQLLQMQKLAVETLDATAGQDSEPTHERRSEPAAEQMNLFFQAVTE